MICNVYRLRERGYRLDQPLAPLGGQLLLRRAPPEARREMLFLAELVDGDGRLVLPRLEHAQVVRITDGGIVIQGVEVLTWGSGEATRVERCRQTWWCRTGAIVTTLQNRPFEKNWPGERHMELMRQYCEANESRRREAG